MSTFLGLQDSTTLDSFENYRRAIFLAFANGSAPITALTTLIKSESTDFPKFHWYEKNMPTQSTTLTASYTNSATQITVAAKVARPGDIIKNLTTANGEIMQVTNVSADGLTLDVRRSAGTGTDWPVAAEASSGSADVIAVIGTSNSEGSGAPDSMFTDPDEKYNYCQIFKEKADITGTAKASTVKWDTKGPWPERLRQALEAISLKMEKAFLEGQKAQWTNATTGKVERTTGGVISFIDSNNIVTPASNTLTWALWCTYMEQVFRLSLSGSQDKLMLCGSGFAKTLSSVAKNNAVINIVPAAETMGLKVSKMESEFGTVYIKTHPLMSQQAQWRYNALILDMPGLRYRYMNGRDLARIPNVQLPDEDAKADMFLAECGMEVKFPTAHMLIKAATTAGT